MVFRRELLEQDYVLQHNTLGLSQVSLLVYMSALVLLKYIFLLKEICSFYHVSALIQEMQDYLDARHPSLCVDSDEGNSNDSSSTDGYLAEKTNCSYNRAEEEFNTFESFKLNKYRPKWVRAKSEILSGIGLNGDMEEIIVGPVEDNGKDLPLGKNLGDYVNEKGRVDMLKSFEEHKKYFPTLWIIVQREAARQVVEVG
jgi:hypothetical protein